MGNSNVVSVLILLWVISGICKVEGLAPNYYATSCPLAKFVIKDIVENAVLQNPRIGAGMIRLLFHDCFVEVSPRSQSITGCDASVLIVDPNSQTELDAIPNLTLHNLDLIDKIKTELERLCPQTVSCADIVAYTASTSLYTLGGPVVDLQGGRFDGLISSASEALANLPAPFSPLSTLESQFASKGLDTNELVTLSGAHTVGKAHCTSFSGRLYNFNATYPVDPSLNPGYATFLQGKCPSPVSATTIVNMDFQTPTFFDNRYYKEVQNNEGLFISDAALYTAPDTIALVNKFAKRKGRGFGRQFAAALIKMSQIGLKTPPNGEIRLNCSSFN